jgi:hypothetical protein
MHILLGLLAILGGAAFWWWRLRDVGAAASDAHDMAGRAWGKYKRAKFRRKVEDSPLEAVEDPVAADVVLLFAMAKEGGEVTPGIEAAIRKEAEQTIGIANPTELLVFGKWVSNHVEDVNNVILRYAKLWTAGLEADERRDLVAMAERIAVIAGVPAAKLQVAAHKLNERLGLQPT